MSFQFNELYWFPPFFTCQLALVTREKQIQEWTALVLRYCEYYHVYQLSILETELQKSPLFRNKEIGRSIEPKLAELVLGELESNGRAKCIDAKAKLYVVYHKHISLLLDELRDMGGLGDGSVHMLSDMYTDGRFPEDHPFRRAPISYLTSVVEAFAASNPGYVIQSAAGQMGIMRCED